MNYVISFLAIVSGKIRLATIFNFDIRSLIASEFAHKAKTIVDK